MWHSPIPQRLIVTGDGESFRNMAPTTDDDWGETGLPVGSHPGAFGARRARNYHEGVDLYCPSGTPVDAVEDGVVVAIQVFTGHFASPPSPWWNDTCAVMVEGRSGVVVYGEVTPAVVVGEVVCPGWTIGHVKQVLRRDKGRPMSMLHLELHRKGTRDTFEWAEERPASLLDPTPFLRQIAEGRS